MYDCITLRGAKTSQDATRIACQGSCQAPISANKKHPKQPRAKTRLPTRRVWAVPCGCLTEASICRYLSGHAKIICERETRNAVINTTRWLLPSQDPRRSPSAFPSRPVATWIHIDIDMGPRARRGHEPARWRSGTSEWTGVSTAAVSCPALCDLDCEVDKSMHRTKAKKQEKGHCRPFKRRPQHQAQPRSKGSTFRRPAIRPAAS